ANPNKSNFLLADHTFSGRFSSVLRSANPRDAPLEEAMPCRVLTTALRKLPARPAFSFASRPCALAQSIQLLDIAEKVPTASLLDVLDDYLPILSARGETP